MSKIEPDTSPVVIPRENPFRAISKMMKTSIGRLPGHLVIIFFVALSVTILCGVFLEFAQGSKVSQEIYLPERLSPEEGKPLLTESQIKGAWVFASDNIIAGLRMENGLFELVARYKQSNVTRYFIRGGYKINGNVLVLQERKDLGSPMDPQHLDYKFYPLEMENINLYANINGNSMEWKTPAREQRRLKNPEETTALIFGDSVSWVKISATP